MTVLKTGTPALSYNSWTVNKSGGCGCTEGRGDSSCRLSSFPAALLINIISRPKAHCCTFSSSEGGLWRLTLCLKFFKLTLLGWHWVTKLYRFSVYSSVVHHLYIALCVYHPKSNLLPSPCVWILPLLTLSPLSTCPCLWVLVCLSCLFACCFQFYIPHMREIIWFLTFSDLLRWAEYSQGPPMLLQRAAFHPFLWLSSVPLCVCTASLSGPLSKDTLVVSMSWPP